MQVLTDWFPVDTVPARVGDYLTRFGPHDNLPCILTWTGTHWKSIREYRGPFEWRGLAFDPAAAEIETDAENGRRGWWVPKP